MAISASSSATGRAAGGPVPGRARGFSLLEVLLVLVLIAAIGAVTAASLGGGLDGLRLRAAARGMANDLRHARAQAIASGQAQRFELDPAARTWRTGAVRQVESGPAARTGRTETARQVGTDPAARAGRAGTARHGDWPAALSVQFTGAREVQPHAGTGAIVFFADGASSGGRIDLRQGTALLRIDVAWLTGEVRMGRSEAR